MAVLSSIKMRMCSEHEFNNHVPTCSYKITAQILLLNIYVCVCVFVYRLKLTNSNALVQPMYQIAAKCSNFMAVRISGCIHFASQ
jgi:hypothetical protein